jgi:hypothetical protein
VIWAALVVWAEAEMAVMLTTTQGQMRLPTLVAVVVVALALAMAATEDQAWLSFALLPLHLLQQVHRL